MPRFSFPPVRREILFAGWRHPQCQPSLSVSCMDARVGPPSPALLSRVCLLLTHTSPSSARCFYLTVHRSASSAPASRQLVCLTGGVSHPTPIPAPTGAWERQWDVLCLQMCSFCSREAGACSFLGFLNCQCSSFFTQQLTQSLNPVSSRTFFVVFFSYAALLELFNASWTLTLPCLGLLHHLLVYVAPLTVL